MDVRTVKAEISGSKNHVVVTVGNASHCPVPVRMSPSCLTVIILKPVMYMWASYIRFLDSGAHPT